MAADPGLADGCLADLFGPDGEHVGVDDGEVGIKGWALIEPVTVVRGRSSWRCPRCRRPAAVAEVDGLPGQERVLAGSRPRGRAGSGSPRRARPERVGAADRPVAARAASWRRSASRRPNGYCHGRALRPEERQRELVHLRLVTGPQRLDVGRPRRARGNAARRRGARPAGARGGGGRSARPLALRAAATRVERLADGAVADGVEVHLEAVARRVRPRRPRAARRGRRSSARGCRPVTRPCPSRYGSSIAAVKFSTRRPA